MLRSLTYHWRVNLAVLLGAAVGAAVLTGALVVGDSVRGSLRDLTLDRLGRIDSALAANRFFREALVSDLESDRSIDTAAPAILMRGSATHAETRARASKIAILGIDSRFAGLYPAPRNELDFERGTGQLFPSTILNETLARQLGADVGDAVVLSFPRGSDAPRDTLLGRREAEEVVGTIRATVTEVIPDRGPGRFGLAAHQSFPKNAFLALPDLQRGLGQDGMVNVLLVVGGADAADPEPLLRAALDLEDIGLFLAPGPSSLSVESREYVLRPAVATAVEAAAAALGAPAARVQTYLANEIRVRGRGVPYSTVTAVDGAGAPPLEPLRSPDGSPAPPAGDDGILLNLWAAADLGARVGDEVELDYYEVGPREGLRTATARLRLAGIVEMAGLAADRTLTPDYPGVQGAENMSDWDPPFPVDLDRIRTRDEDYWDRFGATPKAFVAAATGRRLWTTRHGSTTAVRIGLTEGTDVEDLAGRFREDLLERISLEPFGLRFRAVREEGLRAARGATDFTGLFIGFSLFLIVSAGLLVGLLFRLGVEGRAREVGLLLALGYRARAVRRRFLGEAALLAGLGALVGLGGAVAYAGALMLGLRTVWLPAVGSPLLFLHVRPMSLAAGWAASFIVVLLSTAWTVRRLGKIPAPALLAGSSRIHRAAGAGRAARYVAWIGIGAAAGLVASALASGKTSSPGIAFGTGAALVTAGLALFSLWTRERKGRRVPRPGTAALLAMAARNSSWHPGRSLLSVSLVACACLVIVMVAAMRQDPAADPHAAEAGAGGYSLVAEAEIPVHQDLNGPDARFDLGLTAAEADVLAEVHITPLRALPGDDASCLDLYRPERPRILGIPDEMIERGGFHFLATSREAENPWTLLTDAIEPGVIPAFGDAASVQWILHLGLGKDLVLEDELGREVRLRIVGMLEGSVLQSELLISEESFLAHFPSRSGYGYFLIDAPPGSGAGPLLERALSPFGFDATPTGEKLAAYLAVQNTYLSTFQVLGGLGLLLGTIGLGVVLVRNVQERRGELAALRAFGYRRAQLARLVLAENGFLLLVGITLGAGAALAGVAPRLLGEAVRLDWASLALTLVVVLAVGMLASVAAVLGALRAPLLPALKSER